MRSDNTPSFVVRKYPTSFKSILEKLDGSENFNVNLEVCKISNPISLSLDRFRVVFTVEAELNGVKEHATFSKSATTPFESVCLIAGSFISDIRYKTDPVGFFAAVGKFLQISKESSGIADLGFSPEEINGWFGLNPGSYPAFSDGVQQPTDEVLKDEKPDDLSTLVRRSRARGPG